MFLEIPDLGYPAWSGPRDQLVTEDQIISSLGLGIIHFKEHEPEQGEVVTYIMFIVSIHKSLRLLLWEVASPIRITLQVYI